MLKPKISCLILLSFCLLILANVNLVNGQISLTGDYSPSYNGTDNPWITNALYIGRFSTGTMSIAGGAYVRSSAGFLGESTDGIGTAHVTGTDSLWYSNDGLYIGYYGNGELDVDDGGSVESRAGFLGVRPDSTGTATVDGTGSLWNIRGVLAVADRGIGELNVKNGGEVNSYGGNIGVFTGGNGLVAVNGAGSKWSISSQGILNVGLNGTGDLRIEDGGTVTGRYGVVGRNSAGLGIVTVAGTGSQWNNSSELGVGYVGTGTLIVEDGGVVTGRYGFIGLASGSSGIVRVSGAGSRWETEDILRIGYGGNGVLDIDAGGVVTSSIGSIGGDENGIGIVTVKGLGSQWNNSSDLYVGGHPSAAGGDGTLNIQGGATVSNTFGYITRSADANGSATVTGTGSHWINQNRLAVGQTGNGTLNLANGGVVTSGRGEIGRTNGTGVANVDGVGSKWVVAVGSDGSSTNGALYVGTSGHGTLNIVNGGSVESLLGYVASQSSGTGIVTLDGQNSAWAIADRLFHGGLSTVAAGDATISIRNGALLSVGNSMKVWDNAAVNLEGGTLDVGTLDLTASNATDNFNVTGGMLVVDTILGDFRQDGGTLAPGDSPGLTDIAGDYELIVGMIEFELEGLTRGTEYDAIDVDGLATLNGTMDINLTNGFAGDIR